MPNSHRYLQIHLSAPANTDSMAWAVTNDTPSRRVFTRALSPHELGFFYDGRFNGVADSVENYLVVTRDESISHPDNIISRAWVAVKQIFPLLGATTKELELHTPSVLFVVSELDLGIARPNDTTLGPVQSEEEVHSIMDKLISGSRHYQTTYLPACTSTHGPKNLDISTHYSSLATLLSTAHPP